MKYRTGHFQRDDRAAISARALVLYAGIPVICTVLLAVILGAYTSSTLSDGKISIPNCSAVTQSTGQGNWTISILSGRMDASRVSIRIFNTTPAMVFSSRINTDSAQFYWNDNNINKKFDAGDVILLNQTGMAGDFRLKLVYSSTVIYDHYLPPNGGR